MGEHLAFVKRKEGDKTLLTCSLNIHVATLRLVIVKVSVFFSLPCVAEEEEAGSQGGPWGLEGAPTSPAPSESPHPRPPLASAASRLGSWLPAGLCAGLVLPIYLI